MEGPLVALLPLVTVNGVAAAVVVVGDADVVEEEDVVVAFGIAEEAVVVD